MLNERDALVSTLTGLARIMATKGQEPETQFSFILRMVAESLRNGAEGRLVEHLLGFVIDEEIGDNPIVSKPIDIQ